jgi:NADPH-dependent ferric siderophore reductase
MLLGSWLGDKLMRDTTVAEIAELGSRFRRVVLAGAGLRDLRCAAGDKVQVYIPDAGTRTYSPFAFDPSKGRLELLLFAHGGGPGSTWSKTLQPGDRVRFIGPQGSLGLAGLAGPVALFGDETSLGVARSLFDLRNGDAQFRLEVSSRVEVEPVVKALGLPTDALVERSDRHLDTIAKDLAALQATIVMSGNAKSIQALRAALKQLGVASPQRVKSYWAEGKTGLD